MRRPVSVKSVFLFHPRRVLPLSRSASDAILPSALVCERIFARCQVGVLVSAGAATCESTLAFPSTGKVGPGLGRSHLNSAVPLDDQFALRHCCYLGFVVPRW